MSCRYYLKYFSLLVFCMMAGVMVFSQKMNSGWKQLFNGRDLAGWDTWLRAPNMTGYSDDERIGPAQPNIGLNNDPTHVFTVKDGKIHVSGEVWGAITTKETYGNYHLRFQTMWGEKKYFPKDKSLRDGGLLFHCTGPMNYAFQCWMRSMEMQVQETEIGDFFNVGGGVAEFQVNPKVKTGNKETADQYDPTKPLARHPGRVYRSGNFESDKGMWTTSELIARHSDAVFIVNGFVVNRLFNIFRQDLNEQVVKGQIQFQSEGAEHFYKGIEIRPISFVQNNSALATVKNEITVSETEKEEVEITNSGDAVEIIAMELIGKDIDKFVVIHPDFPYVLKKGGKMKLQIFNKQGFTPDNKVKLRMETVLGPVPGFEINIVSK